MIWGAGRYCKTNNGAFAESLSPGMYIVEINKGEARLKLVQQ